MAGLRGPRLSGGGASAAGGTTLGCAQFARFVAAIDISGVWLEQPAPKALMQASLSDFFAHLGGSVMAMLVVYHLRPGEALGWRQT